MSDLTVYVLEKVRELCVYVNIFRAVWYQVERGGVGVACQAPQEVTPRIASAMMVIVGITMTSIKYGFRKKGGTMVGQNGYNLTAIEKDLTIVRLSPLFLLYFLVGLE